MSCPAFRLNGVFFGYEPDRPVLKGLDLELQAGERLALLGANGSGKTTLLFLMVGLLRPQAGILEAFGVERSCENDFFEVRRRSGLVFQNADDQLFCPTVAEDVAFGPLNLRLPRHEVESRVKHSLKLMDLEDFEDRVTWKLSEGEKRRVCIASVMAMDPEVLLLDEPTGGLDPENREKLIRIISGCGKGLVLVTHETDLIRRAGARAVLLEEGKLREGG